MTKTKKIIIITFLFIVILFGNVNAANIFTKTAYEAFYRYHDFANWLAAGETLSTQTVTITEKIAGTDKTSLMISNTSVQTTKVIYMIRAGDANKSYLIKIKTVTSTGQKFEDYLECKVL